jgi:hypothetical protein
MFYLLGRGRRPRSFPLVLADHIDDIGGPAALRGPMSWGKAGEFFNHENYRY